MTDKQLDELAEELASLAKTQGNNDLAIVLHVYLGSKCVGMGSEFARYSQVFAKEGIETIEDWKNRKNN